MISRNELEMNTGNPPSGRLYGIHINGSSSSSSALQFLPATKRTAEDERKIAFIRQERQEQALIDKVGMCGKPDNVHATVCQVHLLENASD